MSDIETKEEWPNSFRNREELDALLEAGMKSGVSNRTWDEIIAEAQRELDGK